MAWLGIPILLQSDYEHWQARASSATRRETGSASPVSHQPACLVYKCMRDSLKFSVIHHGFLQEDASAILEKRRNASFHIPPASLFTFLPSKAYFVYKLSSSRVSSFIYSLFGVNKLFWLRGWRNIHEKVYSPYGLSFRVNN